MSGRAGGSSEFAKLWTGHSISRVGSEVTVLALPLTAVLLLGGGATETGILVAARTLPIVVTGPFIGVWVDRHPRRSLMVASAVGSAIAIASIPIAALAGVLTLIQLYAVALIAGTFANATILARSAILPGMVGRSALVRANARLQSSDAVAQVAGPSLGGVLVQALTAPIAMAVDAASFLVSAVFLLAIRTAETTPPAAAKLGPQGS